jgi:capsular exopolysaccharide synthesis family protein
MDGQLLENDVEKIRHIPHGGLPELSGVFVRRKGYLVLGGLMGVVLGVLFWAMAPRKYESTAQILVLKKQIDNPISSAMSLGLGSTPSVMTQDFLETHRAVLRSPLVVGHAVEKADLQDLEMFRGEDRLVDSIIKSMKVDREIDKKAAARFSSQVLNVSFQGKVPEECSIVVDALLASYEDFLNDSSRGPMKETLALIIKARKLVEEDMKKTEADWSKFRQQTPVLWKGPMGTTLYQDRIANIDARHSSLLREEAEMKATLDAVDEALILGGGPIAAMEIISGLSATREPPTGLATMSMRGKQEMAGAAEATPANPRLTLSDEIVRLQLKEAELLEVVASQHPDVVSLNNKIKSLQALLVPANLDPSKPGAMLEKDLQMTQRMVDIQLGQLKQQLRENQRSQAAMAALYKTELEEAKKVFPFETQDDSFRRSLERSWFLYENILKRMEDLDIVSSVGGYDAQVISPPMAGEKVFPKASIVLPIALLLGLLVGFGLGYVAEITDKNFHTPDEIRSRLALPLIGHIPVLKQDKALLQKIEAEGGVLHPTICTHYRPRSRDAEAYRGVRTALYFSTRGRGYKTIQVTSPNQGDGKSTLAANLAVSVAQTGKKVILIDADFRRPQQHQFFAVANRVGFASVLDGSAEITEALQETAVPGLSLIPSGPIPANPAELLTSHRLTEVLDVLKERCDLVLIDGPPLLAVSDPSVIAPRVDAVVLALRLGNKSRPSAERAKEILFSLGAHVLGVVVNAVRSSGRSRYGYSYDSYGYGYGYGSEENSRYYQEETQESTNGQP